MNGKNNINLKEEETKYHILDEESSFFQYLDEPEETLSEEKNNIFITSFAVIEKKDENNLKSMIKNINRGRILELINKIKSIPIPIKENVTIKANKKDKTNKRKTLLKRKNTNNKRINSIKKEDKPSNRNSKNKDLEIRNQHLELLKECKNIYEKCLNFYTISEFIKHECDICYNKNGDSNEYIRWENILQCFQFFFHILNEENNFLFEKYDSQKIIDLKNKISNSIKDEKYITQEINARTICKSCFLKIIDMKNIIKCINVIFNYEPKTTKNEKDNLLSLNFQIIQVKK